MGTLTLVFLGCSVIMAIAVFRMGYYANWHWGVSLVAASVPVAFTFFLSVLGLIIGAVYLGAIYKATE